MVEQLPIPLHITKIGTGRHPILAFHGIGQDHTAFLPIVDVLQADYTFYLFDMPFHGKSPALATEKLSMQQWQATANKVLTDNQIREFSVMGFSMGGKFALATLQLFPKQVKSIWLLAPDGVTESPWYQLATKFSFAKSIFHNVVLNIGNFKKLSKVLLRLKLINKSTVKFAESSLATEAQRQQIYNSWLGFSQIGANMSVVAQIITQQEVDIKIFLGRYDALLPRHYMKPLTKRVSNLVPILLETGHHKLILKVAEWLKINAF